MPKSKLMLRRLKICLVWLSAMSTLFVVGEIVARIAIPENLVTFDYEVCPETGMYKAKPGIEGRYIRRNVRNGYVRINNEGWNSVHDYDLRLDSRPKSVHD